MTYTTYCGIIRLQMKGLNFDIDYRQLQDVDTEHDLPEGCDRVFSLGDCDIIIEDSETYRRARWLSNLKKRGA